MAPSQLKTLFLAQLKPQQIAQAVRAAADDLNVEVTQTETGQVSASSAVIQELSSMSAVLKTFEDRQKLQKLVSTEIPLHSWKTTQTSMSSTGVAL